MASTNSNTRSDRPTCCCTHWREWPGRRANTGRTTKRSNRSDCRGPCITGLFVIATADVQKLDLEVAEVVPGWVRWDSIETALPDKHDARQQYLRRLGIRQEPYHIEVLTEAGRCFALDHLRHLAADTPPANIIGGVKVEEWRRLKKAEREAEVEQRRADRLARPLSRAEQKRREAAARGIKLTAEPPEAA